MTSNDQDTQPNSAADTFVEKTARPPSSGLLGRPPDYWLLWVIALASFAFNLYVIRAYLDLRGRAAVEVAAIVETVGEFRRSSFEYTINIDEEIPVTATVPVQFDVVVPVDYALPINTNITIPIETFLGTYRFNAPVFTTIDIDFDIDVPIDEQIDFATTVPVQFDVPIVITFAETPLGPILDDIYFKLADLALSLGAQAAE